MENRHNPNMDHRSMDATRPTQHHTQQQPQRRPRPKRTINTLLDATNKNIHRRRTTTRRRRSPSRRTSKRQTIPIRSQQHPRSPHIRQRPPTSRHPSISRIISRNTPKHHRHHRQNRRRQPNHNRQDHRPKHNHTQLQENNPNRKNRTRNPNNHNTHSTTSSRTNATSNSADATQPITKGADNGIPSN